MPELATSELTADMRALWIRNYMLRIRVIGLGIILTMTACTPAYVRGPGIKRNQIVESVTISSVSETNPIKINISTKVVSYTNTLKCFSDIFWRRGPELASPTYVLSFRLTDGTINTYAISPVPIFSTFKCDDSCTTYRVRAYDETMKVQPTPILEFEGTCADLVRDMISELKDVK